MAGFACRRCCCTAAKCSFSQFRRKLFAYGEHDRDHFIERDKLYDACEGHLRSDQCDRNTGSISVLARIFHQTANRVTYKPEHVHKHGRSGVGTLQWSTAHQLCSSRSSHGSCNTCLCLTAADSTGNCCISHGKISDRTSPMEAFVSRVAIA